MTGRTFGLYLSWRFTRTILSVFAGVFALIYLVDFMEMLRRSSGLPGANAAFVAGLSFLRVPAVSEQVLPFAVLAGSMIAFLTLSRRLELVIARSAGLSAWQFLTPPIAIVLLIGLVSVMVYNPLSADMKQKADAIETRLFGRAVRQQGDTSFYIRQRSVDGQSIIQGNESSDGGTVLAGVTAFVFDKAGHFTERVEASSARLQPGFWTLDKARVITPNDEPRSIDSYRLATNLSPAQVTQALVPPEAVPFWSLPAIEQRVTEAGLDGTGYRLQFQALLARPLLLAAMVLIAAAFSLRFFRFGGVAQRVAGGVASGFVLYVSTKLVADLGGAGLVSAPLAAWLPAVVGSMLGSLALLYQEDG